VSRGSLSRSRSSHAVGSKIHSARGDPSEIAARAYQLRESYSATRQANRNIERSLSKSLGRAPRSKGRQNGGRSGSIEDRENMSNSQTDF
jgi:hypothetical protein